MDPVAILAFAGGIVAATAFFKLRDWNVREDARITQAIEEENRQFRAKQEEEWRKYDSYQREEQIRKDRERKDREIAEYLAGWYDRNYVIDPVRGTKARY